MRTGFADGARLLRSSFDLVRSDQTVLWFPLVSTACLVLTGAFWVFEGLWLGAMGAAWPLFVVLVLVGIYSLTFVGVFFGVALAAEVAQALEGRETSFSHGIGVAWSRLGAIVHWSAVSLVVSFVLSWLRGRSSVIGSAAQVAWSFATFFVVPLIALEGLDAGDARRRSTELARLNWGSEAGGLGALRLLMVIPAVAAGVAIDQFRHVHSPVLQFLLVAVVVLGVAATALGGVVRQVFAVSLYESAARTA